MNILSVGCDGHYIDVDVSVVVEKFMNVDFLSEYKIIFMLIPSLFSFNIPILWYINYTFKNK